MTASGLMFTYWDSYHNRVRFFERKKIFFEIHFNYKINFQRSYSLLAKRAKGDYVIIRQFESDYARITNSAAIYRRLQ